MYLDYHIYCVFDNSYNPGRQQLFYLPNICLQIWLFLSHQHLNQIILWKKVQMETNLSVFKKWWELWWGGGGGGGGGGEANTLQMIDELQIWTNLVQAR